MQWHALDKRDSAFSLEAESDGSVQKITGQCDICVTGSALAAMQREEATLGAGAMGILIEKTRIFARVTPDQKEYVVRVLNDRCGCNCKRSPCTIPNLICRGHVTMMCGDGTNDVGALKQSHCGVGLLARDENSHSNGYSKPCIMITWLHDSAPFPSY
jgi:magnesium-transporting ATPase (P-type)